MKDFYKRNGRVYGANPSEQFAGNPFEAGSLGCYCEVIEAACADMHRNNYKEMKNLKIKAERGLTLSRLEEYISKGKPVIIWATVDPMTDLPIIWKQENSIYGGQGSIA